jgi:hypothetical protein
LIPTCWEVLQFEITDSVSLPLSPLLPVILAENFAGGRIHKVSLPAGKACDPLIGVVVGHFLGDEALNLQAGIRAAVKKRRHWVAYGGSEAAEAGAICIWFGHGRPSFILPRLSRISSKRHNSGQLLISIKRGQYPSSRKRLVRPAPQEPIVEWWIVFADEAAAPSPDSPHMRPRSIAY